MKTKILSLICILALLCSMSVFASAATPIEIDSLDDFALITANPSASFVLTKDITATGTFAPIPTFSGTFDGQGYTITGLKFSTNDDNTTALFAENSGTIKNLHLEQVVVAVNLTASADMFYATAHTAGLVGYNMGTISKCAVQGALASNVSGSSFRSFIGGIAAYNCGTISDCYAAGSISAENNSEIFICAGGLVGRHEDGTLSNCLSLTTVSARSSVTNYSLHAGSCVGHNLQGNMTNIYSHTTFGDVVGTQNTGNAQISYAALDTAQIIDAASYTGFDFENTWKMDVASAVLRKACKHTQTTWKTTTPATYAKEGVQTLTCLECGKGLDTKSIAKLEGIKTVTVFKDIHNSNWFVKNGAIDFAYNMNLFNGTTETTFGPSENMTRGMFVTVLGRLHGVSSKGATTQFTDVKKKDYFSGYVAWAAKNGIVTGTSSTTFAPNNNVTREQICAMMVRYCNFAKIKLAKVNAPITFTDAKSISSYARKAVAACQQGGVVGGEKDGNGYRFRPQGNASRAEVATIMMNFYKNYI